MLIFTDDRLKFAALKPVR